MNSSNQTYKELAIPYFKETFDCVDEVMKGLHIPYYLIGASAIALELLKSGIKPSRGTKDIDYTYSYIFHLMQMLNAIKSGVSEIKR